MSDKQWVGDSVKTEVIGHPGTFVYQDSRANAWLEADDNGWLLLDPLDNGGMWAVQLEPRESSGE